jgi:hypothetical protein
MLETIRSQTGPCFPYGTFAPEAEFREQYALDYTRAHFYPLPDRLPSHHPLLQRLTGVYPLSYALPPWWQSCLETIRRPELRHLLSGVSPAEFRAGCVEATRWKTFREGLSPEERHQVPSSPRIAGLLENSEWAYQFKERGAVEAPEQLKLIISTHPRDFLYMSNGRDWRSCQHFHNGQENHRLPGNFYDTGVAIAMLLAADTRVEDEHAVLARTTLRVLRSAGHTVVGLGRTYHNHGTLALLLLARLSALLDNQYLSWGFLSETETLYMCQEGLLGPALRQRLDGEVWAESEPFWLPEDWHPPYVDGGEHEWQTHWGRYVEDYTCKHLEVSLMRVQPRPFLQVCAEIRQAITRLCSQGMYSAFA